MNTNVLGGLLLVCGMGLPLYVIFGRGETTNETLAFIVAWGFGSLAAAIAVFLGDEANERLNRVNQNLERVISLLERLDESSAVIARGLTEQPVERQRVWKRLLVSLLS